MSKNPIILFAIFVIGLYAIMILALLLDNFIESSDYFNYLHVALIIALLISVIISRYLRITNKKLTKDKTNIDNALRDSKIVNAELEKNLRDKTSEAYKLRKYTKTLESKTPFSAVSSLVTDATAAIFDEEVKYLRYKRKPAYRASDTVKELKGHYKGLIEDHTSLKYKHEYILSIFPELTLYFEDEEALLSLDDADSMERFQDEFDHTLDYISKEDYRRLGEIERNQLALNRYKNGRRRSSWIAGIEYEMYIAYLLRKHGLHVEEHGAQRGLNDLGRDLIAHQDKNIYIIQCKRYNENIEVHENTICQLYGTTLEYELSIEKEISLFGDYTTKVTPVLITTGYLSPTAQKFAKILNVVVRQIPMGDYPMIKCNINNVNKIYHLPFDQQYWRTIIDKPGEFYAMTVEEAVQNGFRRAFKHNF